MRIRIQLFITMRIRIQIHGAKPWIFTWQNILWVGKRLRKIPTIRRFKSLYERQEKRFTCKFWSISMLLNPDPHSQLPIRIRTRKAKGKRIRAYQDPQHWLLHRYTIVSMPWQNAQKLNGYTIVSIPWQNAQKLNGGDRGIKQDPYLEFWS